MMLRFFCSLLLFVALGVDMTAQITPLAPQKVGVGTRLPSESLDVNGTVRIQYLIPPGNSGVNVENYQAVAFVACDENGRLGLTTESPANTEMKVNWVPFPAIHLPTNPSEVIGTRWEEDGIIEYDESEETYVIRLENYLRTRLIDPAFGYDVAVSSGGEWDAVLPWDQNSVYITYYDTSVFMDMELHDGNILTYRINPDVPVTSRTFINIMVLVPEE